MKIITYFNISSHYLKATGFLCLCENLLYKYALFSLWKQLSSKADKKVIALAVLDSDNM